MPLRSERETLPKGRSMRHELHLTVAGLKVAGPLALGSVAVGAVLGGGDMAASAALGAALVIANHLLAATSTGWARAVTPNVLAAGYAFFVVRMFAVFAAFAVLAQLPW